MDSHYSSDLQVAVTGQDNYRIVNNGGEEEHSNQQMANTEFVLLSDYFVSIWFNHFECKLVYAFLYEWQEQASTRIRPTAVLMFWHLF